MLFCLGKHQGSFPGACCILQCQSWMCSCSWQGCDISWDLVFKLHLCKGCSWQSNSCLDKYWFTRSCASPSTVGSQLRRRRPVWASFWFWKGKSCFVFTSFFFTSAVFLFFRWQIMEWEDSMSPTLTLHGQVKSWRRARPGEAWASGLGHTLCSSMCIKFCSSSTFLIHVHGESPLNHQLNLWRLLPVSWVPADSWQLEKVLSHSP